MYILRLIRFPNLLLIALTQYLIRYTVIKPLFLLTKSEIYLSELNFFLLVFSTVVIAAGGYIINEVFDTEIDAVNKPEKKIIGEKISVQSAKNIYYVLSATGILLGVYLTYVANVRPIALINALTVGLLWFYSRSYKHVLLVGNIVISFLCSLSVFVVAFSENELIYTLNHLELPSYSNEVFNMRMVLIIITAYAAFAFATSWIREIVKDIEDFEGDKNFGSNTMPVVLGVTKSKIFISLLILTVIISLINIQIKQMQWENKISFWYTITLIEIPLLLTGIFILVSKHKKQFSFASLFLKLIMLTGILSTIVFYYTS